MIIRLDAYDLENAFREFNRDYYSREAYEYILDYYDEIDPDMELDVIAIASEVAEFESIDELKNEFPDEWADTLSDAKYDYASDNDIDEDDVNESDLDMDEVEDTFRDAVIDSYDLIELSNGNLLRFE